jgi:hypothetical protein
MKKIILFLVTILSVNSYAQQDSRSSLVKAAYDSIVIFSISINNLDRFTMMEPPLVDVVERDMAICLLIGARSETLIPARDAMYTLKKSVTQNEIDGQKMLALFNEVGDGGRMLKSYCYRDKKQKFRDMEYLKNSIVILKSKIESYRSFLLNTR